MPGFLCEPKLELSLEFPLPSEPPPSSDISHAFLNYVRAQADPSSEIPLPSGLQLSSARISHAFEPEPFLARRLDWSSRQAELGQLRLISWSWLKI